MASPELVEKLNRGAEHWNQWRKENSGVEIDLSGLEFEAGRAAPRKDLSRFDFSDANLNKARLKRVLLTSANLRRAKMSNAVFSFVDLTEADLSEANLVSATIWQSNFTAATMRRAILSGVATAGTRFNGADLTEAYMTEANLSGADMAAANLSMADLTDGTLNGTRLSGTELSQAVLIRADLRQARLDNSNLTSAALQQAILSGADLKNSILEFANLRGANLRSAELSHSVLHRADLRSSNLQFAIFDQANFQNILLWETQRAGWSIRGILCDRVFWDKDGAHASQYEPGEFERLYSDHTCIEFFYQGGISTFELSTLPALLRHLASLHPDANIRLKSLEETGGGARISISIADTDLETSEKVKADVQRVFQSQLALREDQITRLTIEKEYLENFVSEKLVQRMLSAAAPQATFNAPVYGANLAGSGSRLFLQQSVNDTAALAVLLDKMLAHRDELNLPSAESSRFEAGLTSIKSELEKPSPNETALARSLNFVRELAAESLKKAAGKLGEQAVSGEWHVWLSQLQHWLPHHW